MAIPRPTSGIRAKPVPTEQDELQAAIRRSRQTLTKLQTRDLLTEQDKEDIALLWGKGVWHPANVTAGLDPDTRQSVLEDLEYAIKEGDMIRGSRLNGEANSLERIKAYAVQLESVRDSLTDELEKARVDLKYWEDRCIQLELQCSALRPKNPTPKEVSCQPPPGPPPSPSSS